MLQQQKDAGYRTDHYRSIPMMDGLENFDFCGSHLDVEACLQARVWQLQQQKENKAKRGKPTDGEESMTSVMHTQVWPNMEQFIFTISWFGQYEDGAKFLHRRCTRASKLLRQMRPDIEFSTRFKEDKIPY